MKNVILALFFVLILPAVCFAQQKTLYWSGGNIKQAFSNTAELPVFPGQVDVNIKWSVDPNFYDSITGFEIWCGKITYDLIDDYTTPSDTPHYYNETIHEPELVYTTGDAGTRDATVTVDITSLKVQFFVVTNHADGFRAWSPPYIVSYHKKSVINSVVTAP